MAAASAKSRWILIAVVAGVVVLLAALLLPRLFAGDDPVVRSAGAAAAAPVPPPLDWQACEDSENQQCTFLAVPQSWSNPTGPTFGMHVRRLPAQPTDQSGPKLGSILLNTGGPGMASSGYLLDAQFGGLAELRSRFDIVWPDPRGTGKSEPTLAKCPMDPLLEKQQPTTGTFTWQQVADFRITQQTPLNAECLRLNEPAGRLLGTTQVVRDFDLLRQALGEQQITYLGYSYGTRLGTQYAKTFPQRVRAMVLDGTVDPSGTVLGLGQTQAAGGDATAQQVRELLGAVAPVYDEVVQYLQTNTINDDGVVVNRWTFGYAIAGSLSLMANAEAAEYLIGDVCGLARAAGLPSDPCPAADLAAPAPAAPTPAATTPADGVSVNDDIIPPTPPTQGIQAPPARQLINCADLSGRPDAAALAGLMPAAGSPAEPLTPSFLLMYVPQCAGYPQAWSPIGPMTTVSGVVPLFVNGTADPATPIGGARAMQGFFPGARMVSLQTGKHGIYPSAGSACVNDPVTQYLITAQSPPADIACPAAP